MMMNYFPCFNEFTITHHRFPFSDIQVFLVLISTVDQTTLYAVMLETSKTLHLIDHSKFTQQVNARQSSTLSITIKIIVRNIDASPVLRGMIGF